MRLGCSDYIVYGNCLVPMCLQKNLLFIGVIVPGHHNRAQLACKKKCSFGLFQGWLYVPRGILEGPMAYTTLHQYRLGENFLLKIFFWNFRTTHTEKNDCTQIKIWNTNSGRIRPQCAQYVYTYVHKAHVWYVCIWLRTKAGRDQDQACTNTWKLPHFFLILFTPFFLLISSRRVP